MENEARSSIKASFSLVHIKAVWIACPMITALPTQAQRGHTKMHTVGRGGPEVRRKHFRVLQFCPLGKWNPWNPSDRSSILTKNSNTYNT
jgi:hypothetical protein